MAEREKKKKEDAEEAKKKKKPKPDFEVANLQVVTYDEGVLQNMIKPGHWISATQLMRANNFDFQADLESATVDRAGEPIELEHAPYGLRMSRPLALPKGQVKNPEMYYYVPRRVRIGSQAAWLETKLRARSGGREVAGTMKPTVSMPNYQYYFLVLARDPDRYGYLKAPYMGSIRVPSDSFDEDTLLYYRVILPPIDKTAPVPSHSLTWSTIAYVVWDDLDVSVLLPDQQQAMLDWIHWGGQLIISGPNSLNRLRRTFLSDYLPADEVKAADLTAESFHELNENFTLDILQPNGTRLRTPLAPEEGKTMLGVELQLQPGAAWVPKTGALVAERQVGRGRIAVTAFSLSDRNVVNWPCFDNFFNACILRRPARQFAKGESEMLTLHWRDYPDMIRDPRLVTSLRYFSRDIDHPPGKSSEENQARERELERNADQILSSSPAVTLTGVLVPYGAEPQQSIYFTGKHPDTNDYHFGGYLGRTQSGVGGWTDFSGAAHLARSSLQEAAGIDVPDSSFVLKVMTVYLLVLVPANWGLFRLLGRVEWAWIAAPVIAMVGAVAVVRMAQLDIGFARSRTEIAVLESHGDYHRAHLTRYTALYTSLSSSYTLAFEEPSALAAPFAVDPNYQRLRHQTVETVYFDRAQGAVRLRGFPVQSNSTNMVHSEQMYNLGDGLKLAGDEQSILKVYNGSDLKILDVGVFRRTTEGQVEGAWVGDLEPKTAKTLNFQPLGAKPQRFPQWNASPTTRRPPPQGEVSLARLIDLSLDRLQLRKGDMRLIGWTDMEFKGLDIRPRASQEVFRTLVLSHLRHGSLDPPQSDANHRKDIVVGLSAREPLTDADLMGEDEAGDAETRDRVFE